MPVAHASCHWLRVARYADSDDCEIISWL